MASWLTNVLDDGRAAEGALIMLCKQRPAGFPGKQRLQRTQIRVRELAGRREASS